MKRTAPKLKKLYDRLNRKYFRGSLPENTTVGWSKNLKWSGCIGICYYSAPPRIEIAREIQVYKRLTEFTLLHEMTHIASPDAGHGKNFQAGMMRLAKLGAFRRLW